MQWVTRNLKKQQKFAKKEKKIFDFVSSAKKILIRQMHIENNDA